MRVSLRRVLTPRELSHPFPSPFVNRIAAGHAQANCRGPRAGRARSGLFLSGAGGARACPRRSRARAARSARSDRRGVGRGRGAARARQSAERRGREARSAGAQAGAASLHRLGRRLHAELARHGAAHGVAHGRAARAGAPARRGAACGPGAAAHDPGAQQGSGRPRRRSAPRQARRRRGSRRLARRHRRPCRRRNARDCGACTRAGRAPSRSGLCRAGPECRAGRGRRRAARRGRDGWLLGDADRRRDRLRQDRGLFRSHRRSDPALPPDSSPDAGDRAHRAVSRPFRGALRRASGRMAFEPIAARAGAHLGGGGPWRDRGRGRRAIRAVPALCGSRARHRRRGA